MSRDFYGFTEVAWKAIVSAQQEARRLDQGAIAPGHLLLGLLHDERCVASRRLLAQGIPLDSLRAALEATLRARVCRQDQNATLTPSARQAIVQSTEEARRAGRKAISTEHLLLGLVLEGENTVAVWLRWLGVEASWLRTQSRRNPPAEERSP